MRLQNKAKNQGQIRVQNTIKNKARSEVKNQAQNKIAFLILLSVALLIGSLWLVNYTKMDSLIQNHLFNFTTKTWLIDSAEPSKKFIFYQLPKILLGIAIIGTLGLTAVGFKNKSPNRHKFFLIFLGLTLIPLTIGNVKKFTNVYCPTQLEDYNGDFPHVKIFEKYPQNFHQEKKAQCFPAGHPVTGFALFIFFFACTKKSNKLLGLFGGAVVGWVLSFYQMAKGAHFFGHCLVSMIACFLMAALIARVYEALRGIYNKKHFR